MAHPSGDGGDRVRVPIQSRIRLPLLFAVDEDNELWLSRNHPNVVAYVWAPKDLPTDFQRDCEFFVQVHRSMGNPFVDLNSSRTVKGEWNSAQHLWVVKGFDLRSSTRCQTSGRAGSDCISEPVVVGCAELLRQSVGPLRAVDVIAMIAGGVSDPRGDDSNGMVGEPWLTAAVSGRTDLDEDNIGGGCYHLVDHVEDIDDVFDVEVVLEDDHLPGWEIGSLQTKPEQIEPELRHLVDGITAPVTAEQRGWITALLTEFRDVFAQKLVIPGAANHVPHTIDVQNHPPLRSKALSLVTYGE